MAHLIEVGIVLTTANFRILVLASCYMTGPSFWGLMNTAWSLCSSGRFQSPIDIKPDDLLFDPSLKPLKIETKKISGNISNSGHGVSIAVDEVMLPLLNFSSGPLQYHYNLFRIMFHFGREDTAGSEHTVQGYQFPAEIQLLTYNRDLYDNASQAFVSPKGIAIFAIFAEFGNPDNEAFRMITNILTQVRLKGQTTRITGLPIELLIPETQQYITYEGSFTQPGCYESVTWVVFNRPIIILKQQFGENNRSPVLLFSCCLLFNWVLTTRSPTTSGYYQLEEFRTLNQGVEDDPETLLERNYRPTMPINNRPIRTNINFQNPTKTCSMHIERHYDLASNKRHQKWLK